MPLKLGSLALAPLFGVALGLGFPPYDFWILSFGAITGLLIISFRLTWGWRLLIWWVAGSSFFLFLMPWLRVVGSDAWVAASLALALWWALASIGVGLVMRLPAAPIWLASVLTSFEILKSRWPFDGFPWGQFAYPLSETFLANYLPFVASLGLTWVGLLICSSIAWVLRPPNLATQAAKWPWLVTAGALLLLPLPLGVITQSSSEATQTQRSVDVAMIQGNVPEPGLDFNSRRQQVLKNHLDLSGQLAKQIGEGLSVKPDLVIWPENSSDIDPLASQSVNAAISEVVNELDAPTLVGAVVQDPSDPNKVLNAGILWRPQLGDSEVYIKQHPVLFGEFVPFRPLLTRFIGRFERVPRDFGKGDTPGVFNIGGVPVGDVICFEVADDAVVRNTVRAGAQVLIVQTNNATYNLLGQTEQQLQISKVRAREFDRYVLVAATSGISAVVDNTGEVLTQTEELTPAIIEASVPTYEYQTFSARFGHSITVMLLFLAVLGVVLGVLQALRRPTRS